MLSFIDKSASGSVVYPQADVLFKPFVKAMIVESRKFFPWAEAMKNYIMNLPGTKEKKDSAIRLLSPFKIQDLDEMDAMLQ